MVSGSFSLRYSRFFSPFPHGTGSLSVSQEYLVLADGPAGFIQGFTCPALLRIPLSKRSLPIPGYHRLWPLFPKGSSSLRVRISWSYNPNIAETTSVWTNPISLAATIGITFVFSSSGYLDVSVHRVCLPCGIPCLQHGGLPHSDIRGSYRVCRSPRLFAAYHVLLRL